MLLSYRSETVKKYSCTSVPQWVTIGSSYLKTNSHPSLYLLHFTKDRREERYTYFCVSVRIGSRKSDICTNLASSCFPCAFSFFHQKAGATMPMVRCIFISDHGTSEDIWMYSSLLECSFHPGGPGLQQWSYADHGTLRLAYNLIYWDAQTRYTVQCILYHILEIPVFQSGILRIDPIYVSDTQTHVQCVRAASQILPRYQLGAQYALESMNHCATLHTTTDIWCCLVIAFAR